MLTISYRYNSPSIFLFHLHHQLSAKTTETAAAALAIKACAPAPIAYLETHGSNENALVSYHPNFMATVVSWVTASYAPTLVLSLTHNPNLSLAGFPFLVSATATQHDLFPAQVSKMVQMDPSAMALVLARAIKLNTVCATFIFIYFVKIKVNLLIIINQLLYASPILVY